MVTRSRYLSRIIWGNSLIWGGVVLVCLAASVEARPVGGAKRESQAVSNAQLREGLHVLQATKKTLESADHDYGGHRVDAIKAMSAAEHQLRLALQSQSKRSPGTGKPGAPSGRTGGRGKQPEPQNISNLQLADAIGILERTRTQLEKGNRDYGGHRAAAVRDLGVAVQQLKTALRFETKK